jgi:hypothetical protein
MVMYNDYGLDPENISFANIFSHGLFCTSSLADTMYVY